MPDDKIKEDSFSAPLEILRRLALTISLVLSVALAFLTDFRPYVTVRPVDFAKKQENVNRWLEEYEQISRMSLHEYIAYETKDKLISVDGAEWQNFFQQVSDSFEHNMPVKGWEFRIREDELKDSLKSMKTGEHDRRSFYYLFFRPAEPPLKTVMQFLKTGAYYLKLNSPSVKYLELNYSPAYELTGFGNSSRWPVEFSYPDRKYSLWIALTGLIIYIILPWPKTAPHIVAMTRWRVILMDMASIFILFFLFFALPFFIIGGTVEALTDYIFFTLIFWILAALGVILIYWAMHYAVYRIYVHDDRMEIISLKGHQEFPYSDISFIQPATLRPPKWLIILSFLSIFLGKGVAQTAGQAGRTALLSSSKGNGLYVKGKDNGSAYIWFSDPMGNMSFDNFDRLTDALKKAKVPAKDDLIEIRAVSPPLK